MVTCIAWNDAVFPNSHWGIASFSSYCLPTQISKAQTSLGPLSVSAGRQSKSRRSEPVCTSLGCTAQRATSGHGCLAVLCPSWMRAAEPTPQPKHCIFSLCGHQLHHGRAECCLQPAMPSHDLFLLPCHPNIPLNTTTVPIHQAVTQFPFMTNFFYQDPIKKQA